MKDSGDWKGLFTIFLSFLLPVTCVLGEEPPLRAITGAPGFHWFGYYDVNQFDPSGRYLLSMEVDFEGRSPGPDDEIGIGMIDLRESNAWIPLGVSRAWGWQQGCRLQWRPGSDREVIWNDRAGGRFVCRILDVETGKIRTLAHPVYHVSADGRRALGADFGRINDMRPGYGYAGIPDPHRDHPAPAESGIYSLDLDSGHHAFLISLAEIVKIPYEDAHPGNKHYFNHIEWNPDGTRFLFLHRWRPEGKRGFRTRMFTADAEGQEIRLVTDEPAISHYTWRDAEHILIHRGGYRLYRDDGSGEGELLLKAPNGHQTFLPGKEWILTDTYPIGKEREMELYLFHLPTRTRVTVGRFHLPPEYRGEYRVDLHPRISPEGTTVVVDSAHEGHGRQLYLIEIGEIVDRISLPNCWIEAEDAAEAPGLKIDRTKEGTSTRSRVLGVHCDEEPGATAL